MGLLGGCATNPFAQFYQDGTQKMPLTMQQRLLPPPKEPQIAVVTRATFQEECRHLIERGYAFIGSADFAGPLASRDQLIAQAKKVGAEVVLYDSDFSHTEEGIMPWLSYEPGQTFTTQQYGTIGGYAYSGSSTTTTPGTYQTEFIPYQRQVFIQGAAFWRRLKPGIFGAQFGPLPDDLRARVQRNTGVLVLAVVEGSPAFRANIMRGDIIVQISDRDASTVQEMMASLDALAGQKVPIKIIRDTQTLTMEVQLNSAP
jgi:hypothetical protein